MRFECAMHDSDEVLTSHCAVDVESCEGDDAGREKKRPWSTALYVQYSSS